MPSTRRHFLFGAFAAPVFALKKRAAPERPGILLIVAGNLGDWMLGCYGNKEIHTPNIDRLAATGMRFLNCVAGSSVQSAATFKSKRIPERRSVRNSFAFSQVSFILQFLDSARYTRKA